MNFSDEQIEEAIKAFYSPGVTNQHPDCIRIAIEWLSAQHYIEGRGRKRFALKHLIENWAGRYVSWCDVHVAAKLLGLEGEYPHYGLSARLILPKLDRLDNIGEAFKHRYKCNLGDYKITELGTTIKRELKRFGDPRDVKKITFLDEFNPYKP